MCGRFTLRVSVSELAQLFLPEMQGAEIPKEDQPRFNIAPTQHVICVAGRGPGQAASLERWRWGLVPSWANDVAVGNRMINARAETVDSKPSFRRAFVSRRCLIPADGFFEWKKVDGGKQPYLIEPAKGGVLAMAGLWESNQKATLDGSPIQTFTIITTVANQMMSQLHHRMPVFLNEEAFDRWLDPAFRNTEQLKGLLAPVADDCLTMKPVSKRVNNPRNDDAQCVEPIMV